MSVLANNKVYGDVKYMTIKQLIQHLLNKFLKNNTESQTIYAFSLWHYFGMNLMHNVHPVVEYNLDGIIEHQ
jgi:hypothetical protein